METELKQGKAKRMNKRMKQHVSARQTGSSARGSAGIFLAAKPTYGGQGVPWVPSGV